MISLAKIFKFSAVFFNALGKNVVKAHVRHVRQLKKSHTGKRFPSYLEPKRKQGKRGPLKPKMSYKQKKGLGIAAPNQISRSEVPDLTLTGDMLNSMRLIVAEPNGFSYGITDPEQVEKLERNQAGIFGKIKNTQKKRIISSKNHPIPPDVRKMIGKEMSKQIVRQISKEIRSQGMGVKVYEI